MRRSTLSAGAVFSAATVLLAVGGVQASASERRGCQCAVNGITSTATGPANGANYQGPPRYPYRGPLPAYPPAQGRGYILTSPGYEDYYVAPEEAWRWRRR
jgi:hypothetical protein